MAERLVRLALAEPGLNPYERSVLMYLAHLAGRITGQCEVAVPQIASHCGISERHLYRILKALREKKLVTVAGRSYTDITIYKLDLT